MENTSPFADVQAITGRRTRLPTTLLYSRRHSSTAVGCYALIDIMGSGKKWDPFQSGSKWLATRLDRSLSTIAHALGTLGRPHAGQGDLEPDMPVFMTSTQRGRGRTAVRHVMPGVPYVEVPEWTLGGDVRGLLVTPDEWRIYAILLDKRLPGLGAAMLKARELARLARVKEDRLPGMVRSLESAGLVVKLDRPGKETVLLPVTVRLSELGRVELLGRLAEACGYPIDSCGQGVDEDAATCGEVAEPTPSDCTAPTPSDCTAPTPSDCTAIGRDPTYEDPTYAVPVVGGAAPSERAPDEKRRLTVVAGSPPSATRSPLTPFTAAPLVDWCGRCPGPNRRIETHPDTGHPTGNPCPRCGNGAAMLKVRVA